MKKIIWIALISLIVPTLANTQTINATQNDRAAMRKFLDDQARNLCIETYTDQSVGDGSNLKNLTLAGMNVKDVCNCTVKEMQYYVSDDLGRNFLVAIRNLKPNGQGEMSGADEFAFKQWNQRFDSAMLVCRNKLGKKK